MIISCQIMLESLHHQATFSRRSVPCGTRNCLCCPMMSRREALITNNGSYKMPTNTDCNSIGVVYAIQCMMCLPKQMFYVGQTGRCLAHRVAGHRAAFKQRKAMPIYNHMLSKGHPLSEAKITILECVRPASNQNLLDREDWWISKLGTRLLHGLNSRFPPKPRPMSGT